MQNLTLSPKSRSNLGVCWIATTLFALVLILLGGPSAAQQQGISTATVRSVIVTFGTSSSVTTKEYNGSQSAAGPDNFSQQNFGTFDVNDGRLLLQGGTVEITETNYEVYNRAFISYGVAAGTFMSTNPALLQTIELTQTGYDASTGVRTFSLNNAARDILALATSGGANNGSNRFDVTVNASGSVPDGSGGFDDVSINGSSVRRKSVFTATGTRSQPTSISNTTVIINPNNAASGNITYDASAPGTPKFNGTNLGSFDVNTGLLIFNGGTATTFESGGDQITGVALTYVVFKSGSPQGSPITVQLPEISSNNGTRQFSLGNYGMNVITNLANQGTGTFNLQILSFTASVTRSNGTFTTVADNNSNNLYTAQFTLTGIPIETDTWTGNVNDDWFNVGNWDLNRLPDAITNVIIPNFSTNNSGKPYPNIYSGGTFTSTLPGTTGSPSGPQVDNTNSGPALARNLSLNGFSSTTDRSILRLNTGTLKIYGDFTNQYLSYITRDYTITEFASSGSQQIAQSVYANILISGGGSKSITGPVTINEAFTFDSNTNNIVTTDPNAPGTSFIRLADRLNQNNNRGAQLIGETNNSYVLGLITTSRASVQANEVDANGNPTTRTLGDIGLTLRFTGVNNPGDVDVTRSTQNNYSLRNSPTYSVRRVFGVRPGSTITTNGGLQADMSFTCLPNETVNLRPNNGSIAEQNLALFVSKDNGVTFASLGRDGAPVNYTVTKTGVHTFATFTLGDITNPLPVVLVSFDATRSATTALLTWATATETNSKGFEVQVSTDGTAFRTLGFVSSGTPNSTQSKTYIYVDMESVKFGVRYYRLHQIDLDGKDSYSPVRAVNFDGAASSTGLAAYPNPFTDKLAFNLDATVVGSGAAHVQLLDMTGRVVREQNLTVQNAALTLEGLNDLRTGLYVARIMLPDGSTQTVRIQKQ